MKQVLFILLFLISQGLSAQQQDTSGFCPTGSIWVYKHAVQMYFPHYSMFSYEKDTVVNGQAVKKIRHDRVAYDYQYQNQQPYISGHSISWQNDEFLYEQNDSIYFYLADSQQFYLLHDFSALVGDSLAIQQHRNACGNNSNYPLQDTLAILEQDTLTLGQWAFKRSYYNISSSVLEDSTNQYFKGKIIHNIGGETTFFPYPNLRLCDPNVYIQGQTTDLVCYQDDERGVLIDEVQEEWDCQSLITTVAQLADPSMAQNAQQVQLFPNPTQAQFYLQSPQPLLRYAIYQLNGQLVQQGSLNNSQENYQIAVPHLPAGLYILQLENEEQEVFYQKFRKQ